MKEKRTYVSWAEYKALGELIEKKSEGIFQLMGDEARKAWNEVNELKRKHDKMYNDLMPEVGMGCTLVLWSDRRANTITKVITPNKVAITENKTKCKDWYGDEYEILDELVKPMEVLGEPTEFYTRRKSGRWVKMGCPDNPWNEPYIVLGIRHHSIDPSF